MSVREVVHIHIPRTAGSSLEAHIRKPLKRAGVALTAGHFMWGDYPPESGRLFLITLREPIARAASVVRYIRASPDHPSHERLMSEGLDSILFPTSAMGDFQVRSLVGREALHRMARFHDVRAAINVTDRGDVIVCTPETMADDLARLAARTGANIDPLAPHINCTEAVHWPGLEQRIADINTHDKALWRYISCTRIRNCPSSPAVKDPSLVYRAYSGSPAARAAEPAA